MLSKPFMQIVVPGVAALLALAVARGTSEGPSREMPVIDAGTPYSADHQRIQQAANDSEASPTF